MKDFQDNPTATLPQLQQETKRCFALVGLPFVIADFPIGTTPTPVAHALGVAPTSATLIPKSLIAWKQSQPADNMCVYFEASTAMLADVLIFP